MSDSGTRLERCREAAFPSIKERFVRLEEAIQPRMQSTAMCVT